MVCKCFVSVGCFGMMDTHISFENVSKSFKQRIALNGLSFQVNRGDVFALLGPNGAGKTTSLRIMLKLLEYDSGKVSLNGNGRSLNGNSVSAVLDDHGLYGSLSAYDNIKYYAELYGVPDAKRKIEELLQVMEIDDLKSVPVKDFSSGMLRRCALARALVIEPSLLILDEPTKNLDPQGKEDIYRIIEKLKENADCTVVISSHDFMEVHRLCNRGIIIRDGRAIKVLEQKEMEAGPESLHRSYIAVVGKGGSDDE